MAPTDGTQYTTTLQCRANNGAGAVVLSPGGSVQVNAGDDIVCTFTNVRRATVTVVKAATPEGPTSFDFDGTGAGIDPDFDLVDDGNPANNSRTFTLTGAQLGAKTVTETVPAGWSLTGVDCTNVAETPVADGVSFTVIAGAEIVCTFTDVQDAKLQVVKQAPPEGPTSFDFDATGAGIAPDIDLVDDGTAANTTSFKFTAAQMGAKTVVENVPAGWTLTGASCNNSGSAIPNGVSIAVDPGDDIVCTFTDVQNATVTYAKVTEPGSDPQDFAFDATGAGLTDEALDTDAGSAGTPASHTDTLTAAELSGTKSIAETVPPNWTLTDVQCTDTTATRAGDSVSFAVEAGDEIVCTFTNVKDARLTVVKQADNEGPTSFDFDATGTGMPAAIDLTDDGTPANTRSFAFDAAQLGTKTVVEDVPDGWTLASAACDNSGTAISGGVSIAVDAGDDITCTFENHQLAQVTVIKQTLPDGDAQQFAFTSAGAAQLGSFSLGDGQSQSAYVAPGAVTIDENVPTGWRVASIACTGDAGAGAPDLTAGSIVLDADGGEAIVCTWTNARPGQIAIDKSGPASGTAGDRFTYTLAVSNPGQVPLIGETIAVSDPLCEAPPQLAGKGADQTPDTLDPGDSWTFTCTVQSQAGQTRIDNVATVTGSDGRDTATASDTQATTLEQPATPTPPTTAHDARHAARAARDAARDAGRHARSRDRAADDAERLPAQGVRRDGERDGDLPGLLLCRRQAAAPRLRQPRPPGPCQPVHRERDAALPDHDRSQQLPRRHAPGDGADPVRRQCTTPDPHASRRLPAVRAPGEAPASQAEADRP